MGRKKGQEATAVIDESVADQQTAEAPVATQETQATAEVTNPYRTSAHSNSAGVELGEYRDKEKKIYERQIRFRDGKPSDNVRALMKSNGFMWQPDAPKGGNFDVAGAWTRHIDYNTGSQDRLTAERTYADVVELLLKEKGEGQAR